jgi:hypothetical protein
MAHGLLGKEILEMIDIIIGYIMFVLIYQSIYRIRENNISPLLFNASFYCG